MSNLGLSVERETEDIVEALIPHRNSKVEKGVEFPAAYKALVYGAEDQAEDAFYQAFADSKIEMTPSPGESGSLEQIAEVINHTQDTEIGLKAKPYGISEHAPVIQEGMNALDSAGYDSYLELFARATENSVTETINTLEDKGVTPNIWISDGSEDEKVLTKDYYTTLNYNPEDMSLEPDVQVCSVDRGNPEYAEELESKLEEILEEYL